MPSDFLRHHSINPTHYFTELMKGNSFNKWIGKVRQMGMDKLV
jgi:hypothetical protein